MRNDSPGYPLPMAQPHRDAKTNTSVPKTLTGQFISPSVYICYTFCALLYNANHNPTFILYHAYLVKKVITFPYPSAAL